MSLWCGRKAGWSTKLGRDVNEINQKLWPRVNELSIRIFQISWSRGLEEKKDGADTLAEVLSFFSALADWIFPGRHWQKSVGVSKEQSEDIIQFLRPIFSERRLWLKLESKVVSASRQSSVNSVRVRDSHSMHYSFHWTLLCTLRQDNNGFLLEKKPSRKIFHSAAGIKGRQQQHKTHGERSVSEPPKNTFSAQ